MNTKQLSILNKEFKVKGTTNHSITRGEFEGFPCPMNAWNWSDEKMQKLADAIGLELYYYDYQPTNETEQEDLEDEFYGIMENIAIDMGMKYYEDMTEEEREKDKEEWNNVR